MDLKTDFRVRAVVNIRVPKEWYQSPRLMRHCSLCTLQLIQKHVAIFHFYGAESCHMAVLYHVAGAVSLRVPLDAVIEVPRADGLRSSHSGILQQLSP